MVSFREVEPGAHRHRVRDMSWGQAQPRALKGVLQEQYREHGVGTGISDSCFRARLRMGTVVRPRGGHTAHTLLLSL